MADKKTKEKRGKYKKVECPHCHRFFGNLQNHMIFAHFAELEKSGKAPRELTITDLVDDDVVEENLAEESAAEETEEKEETAAEPESDPPPPGSIPFYCANCNAELRKHEVKCWNCGITLIWDGIK